MRLLIVQYTGDYRETFYRFAEGKGETYYAQKYSVDAVAALSSHIEAVATLCLMTKEPYDELLSNGVQAIGAGMRDKVNFKVILKIIEKFHPTHLILRTPSRQILRWAITHKVPTLVTLADSFVTQGIKNKIKNFLLANLLNHRQIHWVGNHGITACKALQAIGVNPAKIIPWDWVHEVTPEHFAPKTLSANPDCWKLVYVGGIIRSKGVEDSLQAIHQLRSQGLPVKLKLAGKGDIEYFQELAKTLGISDYIEFLGLVEHDQIVPLMRSADLVLVPSRPEYPEGFPMTIYEALCSRTPIVASDHPMFLAHLQADTSAAIFPAGDVNQLAAAISRLLSNPELYQQLSLLSNKTWNSLQIPVKWAELVQRWVFDSAENRDWLAQHHLSSGRYDFKRTADEELRVSVS